MLTLLSLDVSLTSDRLSLMMGERPLGSQLSFSAPQIWFLFVVPVLGNAYTIEFGC